MRAASRSSAWKVGARGACTTIEEDARPVRLLVVEDDAGARLGLVFLAAVLRKHQAAALVAVVQVERQREPSARRLGAEVVAVGTEKVAAARLVARDDRRLEDEVLIGEGLEDFGGKAFADLFQNASNALPS